MRLSSPVIAVTSAITFALVVSACGSDQPEAEPAAASEAAMVATATANGFYGPQGRSLRLAAKIPNLNEQLNEFNHNGLKITNFEMETSALYALSGMLGHNACTVCAIIANRFKGEYSKDYKLTVDKLIQVVLTRLAE